MPDSLFNIPRTPWVFTFMGYILLAPIGFVGALLAWVVIKIV